MKRLNFLIKNTSSSSHLLVIPSMVLKQESSTSQQLSARNVDSQHHQRRLLVGAAWPSAYVHCVMLSCTMLETYCLYHLPAEKTPLEKLLLDRDPKDRIGIICQLWHKDGQRIRRVTGISLLVILTCSVSSSSFYRIEKKVKCVGCWGFYVELRDGLAGVPCRE